MDGAWDVNKIFNQINEKHNESDSLEDELEEYDIEKELKDFNARQEFLSDGVVNKTKIIPNRYVKMVKMLNEKKHTLKLEDLEQFFEQNNDIKGVRTTQTSKGNRTAKSKKSHNNFFSDLIRHTIEQNNERTKEADERAKRRYRERILTMYEKAIQQ